MTTLFPDRIETDRLVLELLQSVDPLVFYRICSADPDIEEVTEYLTWKPHTTSKETVAFLDHVRTQYEENDGVQYVIRPREASRRARSPGRRD